MGVIIQVTALQRYLSCIVMIRDPCTDIARDGRCGNSCDPAILIEINITGNSLHHDCFIALMCEFNITGYCFYIVFAMDVPELKIAAYRLDRQCPELCLIDVNITADRVDIAHTCQQFFGHAVTGYLFTVQSLKLHF